MSESLLNSGDDTLGGGDDTLGGGNDTLGGGDDTLGGGERPDWLPEKYKTPEDLAAAYKALESKLGTKEEDLRKAIGDEMQADLLKDRPETAGDYKLPDSIDESAAVDNDLLKWWSEHSFEKGYSQEAFEQGIEMYAKAVIGNQPDLEAEAKRLGDNANDRIAAASQFAIKNFPEEQISAVERLFETAEGVMLMETIMEMTKDGNFSGDTSPPAGVTEAQLQEMMRDPRYWQGDAAYVKKVQEGFAKLYG